MENNEIRLRRWTIADASELFKLASDSEVGPRAGWPPHKDMDESRDVIRNIFMKSQMWAIELLAENKIIGCVGFLKAGESNTPIADDECEVGYWIGRKYWNKGYCTQALKLIIDYCFQECGFSKLWGTHFLDNPPSGHVMEKCGFEDTGYNTTLPNLGVGGNKSVRVLYLTAEKQFASEKKGR